MPSPNGRSLGRAVSVATLRNLLCGALLVASFLMVRAVAGDTYAIPAPEVTRVADQPSQAERLVGRHACWTGEAPRSMRGVLPGHVVVTVDGKARAGGDRLVGMALEQIFEGVDHGLTVHGFCR